MKSFLLSIIFIFILHSTVFALRINDNAPFFSLKDNNGKYFNLTDYVGEKKKEPVKGIILNFFASYCAPCRYELPVLNSLVDEFEQKGIKVVIVGYGEDFDRIMRMLNPLKVDKPIILSDKYSKVGDQFGILGLPITFIIGADGRIKEIILGEIPNIGNVLRKRTAELFR